MTQSHRCWFIRNIWKSDYHLNMTLGTDIKFTLSFLSAKSLCWWKWILSYFKTQKLWSKDKLNTNGWSLSSDVDSAVLSILHTSVTLTFQGQPLLSNSCWTVFFWTVFMIYAPQSPTPLPILRLMRVHMNKFSQPEGIPAGTEPLRQLDLDLEVHCKCNMLTGPSLGDICGALRLWDSKLYFSGAFFTCASHKAITLNPKLTHHSLTASLSPTYESIF